MSQHVVLQRLASTPGGVQEIPANSWQTPEFLANPRPWRPGPAFRVASRSPYPILDAMFTYVCTCGSTRKFHTNPGPSSRQKLHGCFSDVFVFSYSSL